MSHAAIAMKPPKSNHGGARKGAGRKPTGSTKIKVMLSLDPEDVAKLDSLTANRSAWVTEKIRRAKSP